MTPTHRDIIRTFYVASYMATMCDDTTAAEEAVRNVISAMTWLRDNSSPETLN